MYETTPKKLREYKIVSDEETYKLLNKAANTIEKLIRLVGNEITNIDYEYPCINCNVGWGSISSEGCKTCHDDCSRLKEYNIRKFNNLTTEDINNNA